MDDKDLEKNVTRGMPEGLRSWWTVRWTRGRILKSVRESC